MWKKIPPVVYVVAIVFAVLGGWLGNLCCIGYDLWNGPFLPQAGVDPNPAGWEGWWIAGGAAIGVGFGSVGSLLALLVWRAFAKPRPVR